LFYATLAARSDPQGGTINPLHLAEGAAYSDAFLVLVLPLVVALLASTKLSAIGKVR
jgi:hypothetical protein